ncbi:conserved oligomeric Golgi complex subunit 5-like [Pyrus communis]|uniref:conserved oligomeric Golgi complex subunit 5-like n=1 Tax=Pyrus communis TaxID=23211 RepID=UPI0035C1C4B6
MTRKVKRSSPATLTPSPNSLPFTTPSSLPSPPYDLPLPPSSPSFTTPDPSSPTHSPLSAPSPSNSKIHASFDLLHYSNRALRFFSKLGSLTSDDPERLDLAKATQLHCEISALYNEYDLTGIDVVDSELEYVKKTGDQLRTEERGMEGLNQAEMGTRL